MRIYVLAVATFAFAMGVVPAHAQDLIFASPHSTYSPAPNYPEAAKAAGIQGSVAVQVRIDASGLVTDAKVVRGPDLLQESALQSAKTWKFEPTIIAGKATAVVSTINLTFGTPPPKPAAPLPAPAAGVPNISPANAVPATPALRSLGFVATTDGDKVIGSLKWEIREEASGKILASGDGPVHLKDVFVDESPAPIRRQTPKKIRLTDEFVIEMAEFPSTSLSEKTGFGITGRRTDISSFSWEWFNVQDSKHAVKLQEGGELGIDLQQVRGFWEVTKTEFTTDVSLRIIRMSVDPPGSPPYWRINISKGSTITWPSITNGNVIPN